MGWLLAKTFSIYKNRFRQKAVRNQRANRRPAFVGSLERVFSPSRGRGKVTRRWVRAWVESGHKPTAAKCPAAPELRKPFCKSASRPSSPCPRRVLLDEVVGVRSAIS